MLPRSRGLLATRLGHFAWALGVASLGCRQIVGFDEGPSARVDASAGPDASVDAGGDAGPYVSPNGSWRFEDPICGACMDKSCADEARRCSADGSCTLFEACIAACGRDQTCAAQCRDQVPSCSRSQETWDLNQCVATRCAEACPESIVTLPNSHKSCGALFGSPECRTCCCDQFPACEGDPACKPACNMQCQTTDPIGLTCLAQCTGRPGDQYSETANEAGACFQSNKCAGACGAYDWSCLGKVQLPQRPSEGPVLLYGTVLDFPAGNPLSGFEVKTCPFGQNPTCMPVDRELSDPSGNFTVDLGTTIAANGFALSTYFEVNAPPGLDYQTHLFFLPAWALVHSLRYFFVVYTRTGVGNVTGDPKFGGVLFLAHDCTPTLFPPAAGGVHVSIDPVGTSDPVGYTMQNLQGDTTATATYPYGVGFILNASPGTVTLTAQLQATQQLIGRTPVWVRPDTTTVVELAPTPP